MQWETIEGSEKGSNINLSYILKDIENEWCWWWWLRLGDSYGEKLHVLSLLESYSWYSLLMVGMWKTKQINQGWSLGFWSELQVNRGTLHSHCPITIFHLYLSQTSCSLKSIIHITDSQIKQYAFTIPFLITFQWLSITQQRRQAPLHNVQWCGRQISKRGPKLLSSDLHLLPLTCQCYRCHPYD